MTTYIINSNIADITWKLRLEQSAYDDLKKVYKNATLSLSNAKPCLTSDDIPQADHPSRRDSSLAQDILHAELSIAAIKANIASYVRPGIMYASKTRTRSRSFSTRQTSIAAF